MISRKQTIAKFQEYIGKEKYLEIVNTTVEDTFVEYLKSISSTLSEEQKKELEEYLLSLENSTSDQKI